LLGASLRRLGSRLSLVQNKSGRAYGRRGRRAIAFRPVPRSCGRNQEQCAVDRISGCLRRIRHPAYSVWLLRHDPGAIVLATGVVPWWPGLNLKKEIIMKKY